MNNYFQFLRDIPFFRSLPDSDINNIQNVCQKKRFDAGDVIFTEGAFGDNFFIIIQGSIEIRKGFEDTKQDPLAVYGPKHLFGELAIIDDFPRSATAIAREPSELLSIHRDDFMKIITESSTISISIMKSISAMIRESTSNFLKDLNARNRYLERAYKQLKKSDEQRVTSLKEKEILVTELYNRLKNNTRFISSLVGFQIEQLKDEQHIRMLQKLQDRIRIMEPIHEILFNSSELLHIDPANYLNKLIHTLFQSFKIQKKHIRLTTEVSGAFLTSEDAVIAGLIIYELVNNSFQHAFPDNRQGEIKIDLQITEKDEIMLCITDNGLGLLEKFSHFQSEFWEQENPEISGLRLVRWLVEELCKGNIQLSHTRTESKETGFLGKIRFLRKQVTE